MRLREDLNGKLLRQDGQVGIWLVYHGCKHRIASAAVLAALFAEELKPEATVALAEVPTGADVVEGSCLIRAQDTLPIFLFTASILSGLRRHFIPTYEDFLAFGFDEGKVRNVPSLILEALPPGPDMVRGD